MEGEGGAVAVRVANDVAHLVVDGDDEAALDLVSEEPRNNIQIQILIYNTGSPIWPKKQSLERGRVQILFFLYFPFLFQFTEYLGE